MQGLKLNKKIAGILVLAAAAGIALVWHSGRSGEPAGTWRTATVARDSLTVTINATGTVEPEEVVDIGAQVAGRIVSFGKDKNGKPIDYGSVIEEGMVLAQIDDSTYTCALEQAQAQVQQAQASLQRAQADLGQMNAKLVQARRDWDRAQKIGVSEALSPSACDAYQAAFETAKANVAVDEAAILQARAVVAQAESAQNLAKQNLGYCTIVSPVRGVVIDRRVNIGQTVVASLSAPSLFLIAKDLTRMQIWVAVNEADIGKIHPGQPVEFTVDACPDETFRGEVVKVRLNASMTQNVVTYTVEVSADNSDGRLLPYLTANVLFEQAKLSDVLLAPNAALRWTPQTEQIAPQFREEAVKLSGHSKKKTGLAKKAGDEVPAADVPGKAEKLKRGVLWIRNGLYVRPIRVRTGLSDGTVTQVMGEDLEEGLEVIVGNSASKPAATAGTAKSDTVNPFGPPPMRGGRR